jgi:hypothetical protein
MEKVGDHTDATVVSSHACEMISELILTIVANWGFH